MADNKPEATDLLSIIMEAVQQGKTVTITADEIAFNSNSNESTWSNPSITIE